MKPLILALCAVVGFGGVSAQTPAWQPTPGHAQVPIWPPGAGEGAAGRKLGNYRTGTDSAESRGATLPSPYLYLDCGNEDSFLETNRVFAAIPHDRKMRYEYHEVPGAHSWAYWDARVAFLLQVVQQKLTTAR